MGKVYYNQADSRWANYPYPGPTKANATVKSAGCGPTCCAMVISSCKETIYPNTMCDISRENGFRASTGTDFGLFSYVANRWGLKTRTVKSSYEALQACKDGYFVVISCGTGSLWSTGGHYILAVGADNDKIEIYDPYLYSGKFNQLGRQGKVTVVGNSCFVQIDTFKAYSNAQSFYAYKVNGEEEYKPIVKPDNIKKVQQWLNDTYGLNLPVNGIANDTLKNAIILAWKLQCNKNWGANFVADEYGRTGGGFGDKSKTFAKNVIRQKDNSGKMVKLVQALLWYHGYNTNTFSGNYGVGTVEDVHNFKIQHGLSEDGTCVGQGFWTKAML